MQQAAQLRIGLSDSGDDGRYAFAVKALHGIREFLLDRSGQSGQLAGYQTGRHSFRLRGRRRCLHPPVKGEVYLVKAPVIVNTNMVNIRNRRQKRAYFGEFLLVFARFSRFKNPVKYICIGGINHETVHFRAHATGVKRNFRAHG